MTIGFPLQFGDKRIPIEVNTGVLEDVVSAALALYLDRIQSDREELRKAQAEVKAEPLR